MEILYKFVIVMIRKGFCNILLLIVICMTTVMAYGKDVTDSLLIKLDEVIAERDVYLQQKENRISELHEKYAKSVTDRERFDALGSIFSEYHSYNADSAYSMSQRQLILAEKIGDRNLLMNAMLNKGNILTGVGMYHDALNLIDSIKASEVPDYLKAYYYHSKRTLYGNMAEYSKFGDESEHYARLTDIYRDSLLLVNEPNTLFYVLIRADQLNVHGHLKRR